jgi:nitrate/nitrite transporter NarK
LCATTCQILGDIIYALALPLGGSLKLVMLGRLVSGFGSARALNRRYIADTFPPRERTAASAAFVTAGALGTSVGPAFAAALYLVVPETSTSPYWQAENAPCWVMSVVWFIYLATLLYFFDDPRRPNIQKRKSRSKIELTGLTQEGTALLKHQLNNSALADSVRPLWENIPVMTTFIIYFVLKFILESLLSSTATLTSFYFGWEGSRSGT